MSLLCQVPVTGRVVLEEPAAVQLYRLLIVTNCFHGMIRNAIQVRFPKCGEKLIAVYPPFELGVKGIASILVEDGLEAPPRPFQGVAQAVQRNIEVITSRGISMIG